MNNDEIKINSEEIKEQNKKEKIKNAFIIKKGTYSAAITAIVLAAIIILNVLVFSLSSKVTLEFDTTSEKVNSISKENKNYLKGINEDIEIIVCGKKDEYATTMNNYAQGIYGVTVENPEYFDQTVSLLEKYPLQNGKIDLKFMDTNSTEFTKISQAYADLGLAYGDIIVRQAKENGRVKKVTFEDVYVTTEDTTSMYGGTILSGNSLEEGVTGAISYVLGGVEKKAVILKGHSKSDNTSNIKTLLKNNGYAVEENTDTLISSLDERSNLLVIMSPDKDFTETELSLISDYLQNDGKLGKGLLFFGDASCPALPNLYGFLSEWGIDVKEGLLFETDTQYRLEDNGIYMITPDSSTLVPKQSLCVASYNVPMAIGEADDKSTKVTSLLDTAMDSVVIAPVGAPEDYNDYNSDDKGQFSTCIMSQKSGYDSKDNEVTSSVIAFSSAQIIQSNWAEYTQLKNKDLVLSCADEASNTKNTGVKFVSKTITDESFSDTVTQAKSAIVIIVFIVLLPIATIALGIFIYYRRKNAR